MNQQTFETIIERYPWASWAFWDETFPDGDCIKQTPHRLADFVLDHADRLTPDVVLLGLNRSDDLAAPFANFYGPTRKHYDYRLKEFVQDGGLERLHGAYMTDLVDDIDPDSRGVKVTDADAEVLWNQLRLLGESEYHLICFGDKPFDGLTAYFDAEVTPQSPEMKYARTRVHPMTSHLPALTFGEQIAGYVLSIQHRPVNINRI